MLDKEGLTFVLQTGLTPKQVSSHMDYVSQRLTSKHRSRTLCKSAGASFKAGIITLCLIGDLQPQEEFAVQNSGWCGSRIDFLKPMHVNNACNGSCQVVIQ